MNTLQFLIRHTPFWAIPLIFLSVEFAYIYWLRERKRVARTFIALGVFCLACLVFYYMAGGPEKAPGRFWQFFN